MSNKKKMSKDQDIFIREIQTRLSETIGAKVKLNKAKNSWKMNIEFFDEDQIEDFLQRYGIEN